MSHDTTQVQVLLMTLLMSIHEGNGTPPEQLAQVIDISLESK